ncbi:helix-turn-helix domain-containing protein [uncultured Bacteroides sp.]|uniref:helix-turn-helix domain-containing protein n=1 Tax=uncultured Bacteroides sp. TaxID=162156 RepID=UPI002AAA62CC|nr:helix-turn-helix domain-containing protein [uncultured Bacteroides sp.]
MASKKNKGLDLENASTLDLFQNDGLKMGNTENLKFVVSDTDADDLDIVGHPVIVNSVICAICIRGKANIRINFQAYTLIPGSFVLLAPDTMFICEEGDYSEDFLANYMTFSFDYVKEISIGHIIYDIRNIPFFQLESNEYEDIMNVYRYLKLRYEDVNHPYRKEVIKFSLLSAIYDFSAIYDKYTLILNEREEDSHVTKFIDLLFRNYKYHRRCEFYAKELYVTPKYLSKIMKDETGSTVQDWIFKLILFESKSLLKSTKMTVAQIAEYFNYPDSTSFGKFFKKHENMTPLEYRNQ